MNSQPFVSRWYDRDPALSQALALLKQADTRYHAQVAINIIKVIIEHQQLDALHRSHQAETTSVEAALEHAKTLNQQVASRRWFDADESLRSAMLLLQAMPDDAQQSVIPAIARHIETTLADLEG